MAPIAQDLMEDPRGSALLVGHGTVCLCTATGGVVVHLSIGSCSSMILRSLGMWLTLGSGFQSGVSEIETWPSTLKYKKKWK